MLKDQRENWFDKRRLNVVQEGREGQAELFRVARESKMDVLRFFRVLGLRGPWQVTRL